MEYTITAEDLRTMLLIVPYDTAMDADGTLYIRGNLICNMITLLQEITRLQTENKELAFDYKCLLEDRW